MQRPVYLGVMGPEKSGKTHFALTVYDLPGMDPTRVLCFDNHGSTDPFDIHQWTKAEPWGVRHIDPFEPQDLYKHLSDIRLDVKKGRTQYDAIIVDDWSEFAQSDIDDRLEGTEERDVPGHWRTHGDMLRSAGRLCNPRVTGAHHIAVFQAALMPDPLEPRPQRIEAGKVKYAADTRDVKIRPFLQGAFASWFPYKLDGVFYTHFSEKGGLYKFELDFTPHGIVHVTNRWLDRWVNDPKLPKTMKNPSFPAVWALIKGLPEETTGE